MLHPLDWQWTLRALPRPTSSLESCVYVAQLRLEGLSTWHKDLFECRSDLRGAVQAILLPCVVRQLLSSRVALPSCTTRTIDVDFANSTPAN
jgi:hypothetical protein